MKKLLFSFIAIFSITLIAIAANKSTYIHFNSNKLYSFCDNDIDSISLSNIDIFGTTKNGYITQLIHTKDTTYQLSIESIDSITFVTPRIKTSDYGVAVCQEVDLGLSVNWAGWNLGANTPENLGNLYRWGEIETIENPTPQNYKFYNSDSIFSYIGYNISGTQYDAARKQLSGSWRMPTHLEIVELIEKCSWQWITYKGVEGYQVTGPNYNSIFIPSIAGSNEITLQSGTYCFYEPFEYIPFNNVRSYQLHITKDRPDLALENIVGLRTNALPIRPVKGGDHIEDATDVAKDLMSNATFYTQQLVYDYADYNIYLSQCLTTTSNSQTGSYPYKQGWDFLNVNRHPQWRRHYHDLGTTVHKLIRISQELESPNYEIIARAMRLLTTQMTTDQFGDMPSNERFKCMADYMWTSLGDSYIRGYKARFETQEDIYKWMLAEADSLIAMIEDPLIGNSPDNLLIHKDFDNIYSGNLNSWKGLVYAVKARLLLRNIPNIDTSAAICNQIIETAQKAIDAWRSSDNIYGSWFGSEPRYYFSGELQRPYVLNVNDYSPWSEGEPKVNIWESRQNRLGTDVVPSKFFMEDCLGISYQDDERKRGTYDRRNGYANDPRIMLLMQPAEGPISESDTTVTTMYRYLENNIGASSSFPRSTFPNLYCGAFAGAINTYNPLFIMEELYFIQAEAYYWLGEKAKACQLAKEATQYNIQRHLDFYLWKNNNIYPSSTFATERVDEATNNANIARFESYIGAFLNNENTTIEYVNANGETSTTTARACSTFGNNRWFFNEAEYSLSDLMMQKYIALYMQPEQWTDMRRYHYSNNLNGVGIGINKEIVYPTLRRPHNLYLPYWVDGLTEEEQENNWIQRINYDPQCDEIYNSEELIRLGAYKNYKWLQKPMIWAEEPGSRTALTN